jgi:hypothetical protein
MIISRNVTFWTMWYTTNRDICYQRIPSLMHLISSDVLPLVQVLGEVINNIFTWKYYKSNNSAMRSCPLLSFNLPHVYIRICI